MTISRIRLFESYPAHSLLSTERLKSVTNCLSFAGLKDIEVGFCENPRLIKEQSRLLKEIAWFPQTRYWFSAHHSCAGPAVSMGARNIKLIHRIGAPLMFPDSVSFKNIAFRINLFGVFNDINSMKLGIEACKEYNKYGIKVTFCDGGIASNQAIRHFFKDLFKKGITEDGVAVRFMGEKEIALPNITAALTAGVREIETSLAAEASTYLIADCLEKFGHTTEINLERLKAATEMAKTEL